MISAEDAKQQARSALTEFIGRGQELEQSELNKLSTIVNDLLDQWRDKHGYVLLSGGRPVEWIEVHRDEFNYNKIKVTLHFDGE